MFGRHKHQHIPVGITHHESHDPDFPHSHPWKHTVIKKRCECGDLKTQQIAGHWTAEEVGIRG